MKRCRPLRLGAARLLLWGYAAVLVGAPCAALAARPPAPISSAGRPAPLDRVLARHYQMSLRFDGDALDATAAVQLHAAATTDVLEFRLAPSFRPGDVVIGDQTYRPAPVAPGRYRIILVTPWAPDSDHAATFHYSGQPPAPDRITPQGVVLLPGTPWYPSFAPAGRFTSEIAFIAPEGLTAVAQGELQGTDANHWQHWSDALAGHSLGLIVAPLAHRDVPGPGLTLSLFAASPAAGDSMREPLAASLLPAYAWMRRHFGASAKGVFDLNVVALPGGAGLTAVGGDANLFVVPVVAGGEIGADARLALLRGLADWWWSRRGMPAWLEAGLDTISALEITAAQSGEAARDAWLPRLQAAARGSEGTLAADAEDATASPFSRAAAESGLSARAALVLNALRLQIGDEGFARLLRALARPPAARPEQALTEAEFERLAARVSGQRLEWFWRQWLARPGLPRIDFEWRPVRLPRSGQTIRVRVRQAGPTYDFRAPILIIAGGRRYFQFIEVRNADTILGIPVHGAIDSVQFDPTEELLRAAPGL